MKLLKRHLATRYDLTPAAYRQRWGLAKDYPMAAPAYAAQRSAMAKSQGLGRKPAARCRPSPSPHQRLSRRPQPARRVYVRKRAKAAE